MRPCWVLVLVLLASCLPRPQPLPQTPEPRATVEQPVFDFGQVRSGDEVRHVFPIRNTGGQPLTLEPGRRECGCTVTASPGGTIAAGDAGWVEVAFDTEGVGGERVRTVVVDTNDPEQPELVLTVRGTVRADLTVTPSRAFFGRVPRGASRDLVLEVATAPGVVVEKVSKVSPRFGLRVEKPSEAGDPLRVHLGLRPRTAPGPFEDEVVLTTSSDRQARVVVPVFGVVE